MRIWIVLKFISDNVRNKELNIFNNCRIFDHHLNVIYLLVCHDVFEIRSAKLNISSHETDDLSGVAEFIGDDSVIHAPFVDGCTDGLIRVLRYIHYI